MDQPGSIHNVGEPTPQPVGDPLDAEPTARVSSTSIPPAQQRTWDDTMSQMDVYAERARVALPAAPPGLLSGYMAWAPWVALVFGILGVLVSLVALVGSTFLGPLMILLGSPGTGFALLAGSIISLISSALEAIGGWLMMQRRATGWWLLAFGLIVGLLSSLIHGSILTLIILLLIGYVHLQVKPNYR
jgi:hypothetical protein